jgi:hypothetical protein
VFAESSVVRRAAASFIKRVRSDAVSPPQRSISASVRPHPKHSPDAGSRVQIFLQGDSTDGMATLTGGSEHKQLRPERNRLFTTQRDVNVMRGF